MDLALPVVCDRRCFLGGSAVAESARSEQADLRLSRLENLCQIRLRFVTLLKWCPSGFRSNLPQFLVFFENGLQTCSGIGPHGVIIRLTARASEMRGLASICTSQPPTASFALASMQHALTFQ
ncbi:uncharacterized protein PAN0_021c6055 [Moesziomyces antarcticus]|uniref:Uncharacterized protein n=1 Tax=Pseudozyma antarctica TaxID=84753 RepID=A0A081CMD0_PSEA2|nr:uncharacterized protein PAN0_021c6055 [Moesziomyces antarcticus]GAK67826.1 hypothetical protein PAN0_021c6055 [Moesziomyces antarcticus]